jgi:hypothetical protein
VAPAEEKNPAPQGAQEVAFGSAPALPALQGVQIGAAAVEKFPAPHTAHAVEFAAEEDPAAQGGHPAALDTAPEVLPYLPAAQTLHKAEAGADCQDPGAQRLQLPAPPGEKEPGRQGEHWVLLAKGENLPALQGMQAPTEKKVPGWQSVVQEALPAGASRPGPQGRHSLTAMEPELALYVLAGHLAQVLAARRGW